jgi:hypothetical protein
MYEWLKKLSDEELLKPVQRCPNCHGGILDNGICTNNYYHCNIEIHELLFNIDKEKKRREGVYDEFRKGYINRKTYK